MKYLGKRVLATVLTFSITASVMLTDMSAMQVYAAGNAEDYTEPETASQIMELPEELSVEVETQMTETDMSETKEPESEVFETEGDTSVPLETESVMDETVAETLSPDETAVAVENKENDILPLAATGVNKGFTLSADEEGKLVVEFEDGINEVAGNVEIPKEVKSIPAGIFTNKINVSKLTFEEGSELAVIEENAFFGSSVTSIVLPKSLQVIGKMAFHSSELKELVFENGGEEVIIGDLAFAKNYNLKKIITNRRISAIGESAFMSNIKLEETIDLTGTGTIGAKAFYGCEALDYIIIPDTVEIIGESAFEGCKSLGKHDMAFFRGVNAVQIGNGVKEIQKAAFKDCNGLQELILPANVEKLGAEAFGGCTALKNVKIYNVSGSEPTNACAIELTYDSFPALKGLVLEAYDGKVEEWVGKHKEAGVTFKSLYTGYDIEIAESENGVVKANKTKAKMGGLVTLTVTPEKGYILEYGSLFYAYKDAPTVPIKQIDAWDYSFVMPNKAVIIYATFVEEDKLEYGTELTLDADDLFNKTNDTITYNESNKVLTFDKPWQNVRVQVKGKNGRIPLCSQLVFTSSNPSCVTVDEQGNIRAIAPTTSAKITVAFKDKESKTKPLTFTVKVGAKTYVKDMVLEYKANKAQIDTAMGGTGEAAETGYDIITYPASLLNVNPRTVTVTATGWDSKGERLDVEYKLSSNDTGIAKPKAGKFIGSGSITIPKGTKGETIVTVQANDGAKTPAKKQFIIRVVDDTPRLVSDTIKVDPQSTLGTFVDMVSVYDEYPDADKLAIYKKVISKGNTVYKEVDNLFKVTVLDGKIYVKALESENTKYEVAKEYIYKDTYFIGGIMEGSAAAFYVPVPKIIVYKKDIKPTVTMSGKINLFYNGTAPVDKSKKVTVKQNQKDLEVEEVYLLGRNKTNGVNANDDNAFAENFTVDFNKEKQTIKIIRTPGDENLSRYTAGNSKGKPVLDGKIRIKYKGYTTPFDIQITVPTETVKPSYKLSLSKIKLNTLASGQEYEVSFIDTATKQTVDLVSGESIVKLDIKDSGTTMGLIEEPDNDDLKMDFDEDNETVNLKIATPKNGKIVLVLLQPEWEDQSEWNNKSVVKATVNVTASSKYPEATFDKLTLSLNAACPAASDYTGMKLNQEDAELLDTQIFKATGNKVSDNILVYYDSDSGKVIAEIEEGETVAEGTYKFTCTPQFRFKLASGTASVRKAKPVTLKVKVKNAAPYIALNKTSFTLNANCNMVDEDLKYDFATSGYSWKNLPAEYSDYSLSDEYSISYAGKGTDYIGADNIRFEIDESTGKIKIYLNTPEKIVGKGTYKVEGLKLILDDEEIPLKPVSFKLNVVDKTPSVSVSGKGEINPLDPTSKIVYTPKLSNINGTVLGVELREVAANGSPLPEEETHFVAEHNTATGKTIVRVKALETDPGTGEVVSRVQLENRTYRIQLYYELSNGNGEEGNNRVPGTYRVSKDKQITLKQTMPTLKINKTDVTFYAGDKSRTQTIKITKKTTNAVIRDIEFSSKTPPALQKAFKVESFDRETGKMVLRLVNSAFIKQETEQTLTFEIKCDGQLKNTTGTTFEVKVKVIK